MSRKWRYICMDCGRKARNDNPCKRCGSPNVDLICCNTCDRARVTPDNSGTGYLYCITDKKQHELGDDCSLYLSMRVTT